MDEMSFDEDLRKENEIKRLLIENEIEYWIGNPVVQIIHGSLILDQIKSDDISLFECTTEELLAKRKESAKNMIVNGINSTQSINQQPNEKNNSNKQPPPSSPQLSAIVVLGIHNSKSPVEMFEFISERQFSCTIEEIRVIKTTSNIMYGMILFFQSQEESLRFFEKNFGQRFNSIEEDICILRPVFNITFSLDTLDVQNEEESLLFSRHSSKNSGCSIGHIQGSPMQLQQNQPTENIKTMNPAALSLAFNSKQSEATQIINCAICQEVLLGREIEQEGGSKSVIQETQQVSKKQVFEPVLSIMCGHYFHAGCLSKWQDSICPLCRYHQQPPKLSYCEVCRNSDTLWMCLVCGSINCGMEFMENSHVKTHYIETKHTYSMEIESKFVYDHARESFVHRLMQNLADGKIVEIEDASLQQEQTFTQEKDKQDKKGNNFLKEYEAQMSASLEAQRKYFQIKLSEIKRNHSRIIQEQAAKKKALQLEIEVNKASLAAEESSLKEEEDTFAETRRIFLELNKQKNAVAKSEGALSLKYNELDETKEREEEKNRQKLLSIKEQIDLKLQEIHDVQNHLKANKKIIQSGEDMSNAALLLIGGGQGGQNKKHRKNRK